MNRFEEFEKDFKKVALVKGMRCVKIELMFEDEDGGSVKIGLERDADEEVEGDEE